MLIHEDRFLPAETTVRKIAKVLYAQVRNLPIISPHGHTQAGWFAKNEPFPDPAKLFVQPDHYVYRMLYSQGISLEDLEIGVAEMKNPRKVWGIFASHYYLFRGTPSRMWLDFVFQEVFGLEQRFSAKTADLFYDTIAEKLKKPEFLPRALFERFNIEVLTTTDSPLDSLDDIKAIRESGWKARIVPAFRPDPVVDPEFVGFSQSILKLGEQNGEDSSTWRSEEHTSELQSLRHLVCRLLLEKNNGLRPSSGRSTCCCPCTLALGTWHVIGVPLCGRACSDAPVFCGVIWNYAIVFY